MMLFYSVVCRLIDVWSEPITAKFYDTMLQEDVVGQRRALNIKC